MFIWDKSIIKNIYELYQLNNFYKKNLHILFHVEHFIT